MNVKRSLCWLMVALCWGVFFPVHHASADEDCTYPIHDAFLMELQPGVWHGVALTESSADKAFLIEITPTTASIEGAHVQRYVVQPEFDGRQWNDVLRVMIPAGHPPLEVHVRIYDVSSLPVIDDFTTVLEPGVWHGWRMGETIRERAYIVEISPRHDSVDGAHIERYVVQPEWNGSDWHDVLRIMLAPEALSLDVHVRVRAVVDWPILLTQQVTAQPGDSVAVVLGLATYNRAMVAEMSPVIEPAPSMPGPNIETYAIQPEYDGTQWNDVLRFATRPEDPVVTYTVSAWMLPGVESSVVYMPVCASP